MAAQNEFFAFDKNTVATHVVVTPPAGKRVEVYGYTLVNGVATAQTVQFKSAANNISGVMSLPSAVGGGIATNAPDQDTCLFRTNEAEALGVALSAATQVGGHIAYKIV